MADLKEHYYCVLSRYGINDGNCFIDSTIECYAFRTASQQFVCPSINNGQIIFETPPNVKSETFHKALMDRILYME